MNYYLFIPFFLIILFFLPIKLEVRVSFNVLEFSGALGAFLYNKKLMHQQFWIKGKKIITKKEDEIETKELDLESKEVIFLETFTGQIKDKTRLKEISILYNLGAKDAFASALMAGYVNFAINLLFTNIKNQKPTASLSLNDTVSFNREICQFVAKLIMTISLFDILYSFINTIILSKRKHSSLKGKENEKVKIKLKKKEQS